MPNLRLQRLKTVLIAIYGIHYASVAIIAYAIFIYKEDYFVTLNIVVVQMLIGSIAYLGIFFLFRDYFYTFFARSKFYILQFLSIGILTAGFWANASQLFSNFSFIILLSCIFLLGSGFVLWFIYTRVRSPSIIIRRADESKSDIVIKGRSKTDVMSIRPSQLLYIKSSSNYCEVYFLNHDDIPKKEIFRISLKELQDQLKNPTFMRVHKSYILSLSKIVHISGNANNTIAQLMDTDTKIPIARSKRNMVLNAYREFSSTIGSQI